ncbi:DeoR family transcriptional regulator [Pontibacillus yanchengensis]|uniref:DeoR family transcriptional regulator n=2 Tax=Pontibacillus yanchengensis TaxID=462910 RepID=A0ACC7VGU3_9BACI|nr:DeoR/GlpR family DNA-binding transcription regulator [Pontibacillus yanchengensis]MYL34352.1 DeoR family transcriptional regulator [Pontibacillus yanchengensis]MYL53820.1 DeoR family transcriptional regulator [Pontibacillus yanchengensis]
MLQIERRQYIIDQLNEQGNVHIEQLADDLNVSGMTVRRDLVAMEKEGKLVRSHGGAVLPDRITQEIPYQTKLTQYHEEKESIARKAAEMIPDHAKIMLDSGTTTLEIAKLIKHRSDLVVVTNDVKISMELLYSDLEVITTGGELQKNVGAFLGATVHELLKQIKVDLLFLGAHAIDLHHGFSAPTLEKAHIKKLMLQSATTSWVVADHSKFNKRAFAHVSHLDSIDGVITDQGLSEMNREKFTQDIQLYFA